MLIIPLILTPELIMFSSSLLLCLLAAFCKNSIKTLKFITITALALTLGALFAFKGHNLTILNGLFVTNDYIFFSKILLLSFTLCGAWLFLFYKTPTYEASILLILSVLGMMVMLSANDLMALYLGVELQSLALYILVALNRSDKSLEAALKYFILGAVASGSMLYGISLVYGATGTTGFNFLNNVTGQIPLTATIGIVLILIGFAFKVASAPFHMWAPDVYEGASLQITSYLATISKASYILFLGKFLIHNLSPLQHQLVPLLKVLAVASLFVGAFGAILQTDIKRLLAYSSINHVGFMLIGVACYSEDGMEATSTYLLIYLTMALGVFACIALYTKESQNYNLSALKGLHKTHPFLAFCIAVLMLSMAGVPPLAGFLAKFYILSAAISSGLYYLSALAVLSSVIAAFYYLKIIKIMYFEEPEGKGSHIPLFAPISLLAKATVLFNLFLMVF